MKTFRIRTEYKDSQGKLDYFIKNFDTEGTPFGDQKRNSLRLFKLKDFQVNIKSFKVPNVVNQIAYSFFRKSKAQRSYEYGLELIKRGIGTPQPIAYYEFKSFFLFKKSYYLSEQVDCDLTYRELTHDFNYPDYEAILRAFTRFTFQLHEKGIKFLDHSPGNTLIKKVADGYEFFLVDLNRMEFKHMNFEDRIKNFDRLTIHKSMVEVMSDEYAKVSGEDYDKIVNLMWEATEAFQAKHHKKQRLKKRLRFWRT
ncbi:lipopolysaccharide kinase InaA family protein [Winogradskyella thalassocola]|uniref:Lipopolysaccharide kinase (Kdo/WaaP) family protein n=1 Tax=Winogradskyella thalassocola TaxID=262004 RepID=A0A1G8EUT4_9FLAO|nr:lipopolysaccharide kinase InaA family protein [Winogradskyella thalassocola]SDH73624.1 Lipopolysaccharide kinase (Kdo/WaaP) family protein [Winogradskyella thalassocola]